MSLSKSKREQQYAEEERQEQRRLHAEYQQGEEVEVDAAQEPVKPEVAAVMREVDEAKKARKKLRKKKKKSKEKEKEKRRKDRESDGNQEKEEDATEEQPAKQAKIESAQEQTGDDRNEKKADKRQEKKQKPKQKHKASRNGEQQDGQHSEGDPAASTSGVEKRGERAEGAGDKEQQPQQQENQQNANKKKKQKKRNKKKKGGQKTLMQRDSHGLMHWLDHPVRIDALIRPDQLLPMKTLGLHPRLLRRLKASGFSRLFPVQAVIVPDLLRARHSAYPAGDICVSAPTGSGKTLAYVIPILNRLCTRVVPQLRTVVVMPTRQLVQQVYDVFEKCARDIHEHSTAPIRIAMCAGQASFAKEQALLRPRVDGSSAADVVVTTPGRLVDHIDQTDGFTMEHVEYLVVDEADRLLMQSYHAWLAKVHGCLFANGRPDPTNLTPRIHNFPGVHVQKLFFSATLSRDPELIANLRLCFPRMYLATQTVGGSKALNTVIPPQLQEHSIVCGATEKPLVLLYLLSTLQMDRTLVFASSVDTTTRLYTLLKLFGSLRVKQVSSAQASKQNAKTLKEFERGEVSVLVCTDAMARGIDLANVENVVCYDCPTRPKTYIHRVGRAARAGAQGSSYTLVQPKEVGRFKRVREKIDQKKITRMNVGADDYVSLVDRYELALQELSAVYNKNVVADEEAEEDAKQVVERQLVRALNIPEAGAVLRQRREEGPGEPHADKMDEEEEDGEEDEGGSDEAAADGSDGEEDGQQGKGAESDQ